MAKILLGSTILRKRLYEITTSAKTHWTMTNESTEVGYGNTYTTTLNAESGYSIKSVVVTMNSVDITASAYNSETHTITIAQVTGNIVINANAEDSQNPTVTITPTSTTTFSFTCSDNVGVVQYQINNEGWQDGNSGTFETDLTGVYTVYAKDSAGNIGSSSINAPRVVANLTHCHLEPELEYGLIGSTYVGDLVCDEGYTLNETTIYINGVYVIGTGDTQTINIPIIQYTTITATAKEKPSGPSVKANVNAYTWEELSQISDLAQNDISIYANYNITVGAEKEDVLNGTFGDNTWNNVPCKYRVIGLNHNKEKEGYGITFELSDIYLDDSWVAESSENENIGIALNTGNYWEAYISTYTDFVMNTTNTNVGGWNASFMKNTVIPEFKTCISDSLLSKLRTTTKYTDNVGGGSGNVESNVITTEDDMFLLAEYEVFGSGSYANSYEQNNQLQYDYYNGKTPIKVGQKEDDNQEIQAGSPVFWWLRSCSYGRSNRFCRVDNFGLADFDGADCSYGFAPAFVI